MDRHVIRELAAIAAKLTSIQAAKDDVAEQAAKLLEARRDPKRREALRRAAAAREGER